MADSLSTLHDEMRAFHKSAESDELTRLRTNLAAAKRDEASSESASEVQRLTLELALANDEVTRRGAQVRSLQLQLKSADQGEAQLRAVEDELEQRTIAHEAALASHRSAELQLAHR